MTFADWINRLISDRFKTKTALANAVGMQLSPFTRGIEGGTLSIVNLLKLAKVAEVHPSMVLRLAGKADTAALIEEMYGSGADALTLSQRMVVGYWDRITDTKARDAFLTTMEIVAIASDRGRPDTASTAPAPTRGGTPRATRAKRRTPSPLTE